MTDKLDVHLFTHKNKYFLFDVAKFKVEQIEPDFYSFLGQYISQDLQGEIPKKFRRKINKLPRLQPEESPPYPRQISGLTLLTTQRCNMRCTYCYATDGSYGAPSEERDMSQTTAFQAIDQLFALRGNASFLIITFFGGEPLVDFKLVKKVVAYAKQKAASEEVTINFILVTNGTLLTPEVCQTFIDEDIRMVLSLDGDKEINDSVKHYRNSHYDAVMSNIQPYKDRLRFTIRATISKANFQRLPHVINHFAGLGFPMIVFDEISPAPDDSMQLVFEDNQELYQKYDRVMEELCDQLDTADKKIVYPFTHSMVKMAFPRKNYYGCSAGRRNLSIDAHGNIYACHREVGRKECVIGHVSKPFDWSTIEPLYQIDINSREDCKSCWARYLCSGDCFWSSAIVNKGDIAKPNVSRCNHIKKQFELGMYYYVTRIKPAHLRQVMPNLFRSLRISAGHHIKAAEWDLVKQLETTWMGWVFPWDR
jgi:uncharacterized protein